MPSVTIERIGFSKLFVLVSRAGVIAIGPELIGLLTGNGKIGTVIQATGIQTADENSEQIERTTKRDEHARITN